MKFGEVFVETEVDEKKFIQLIESLNLVSPVLVKPNWGSAECYTEAQILDWTLAAIPGEKIVIESHGWARTEEAVLKKDPGPLTKANLRKGEKWFIETSGIGQVLARHGVEYLNLTEEIWAGRAADSELIRQAVETNYAPVQIEEMYAKVPARIYDLRGGTLLSLSKYKLVFDPITITMANKNLFGLIPGPSRGKYHGDQHAFLNQSIVDINKVYRSLFTVKGVVDAVLTHGDLLDEAAGTKLLPGCGVAFASENMLALDAFAAAAGGLDPQSVGHLVLAAKQFGGGWNAQLTTDVRRSGVRIQ